MLLTQDRCTKNYLLYLDLNTTTWQMFAYDLKSALNADAGYPGGRPATDYCILECAQWNSPLFCDRFHPQVRDQPPPSQAVPQKLFAMWTARSDRHRLPSNSPSLEGGLLFSLVIALAFQKFTLC